jgi:ankyrin repeat protein
MYAITLKPIEIIELLLSYGADVNMVNTRYQSSLMYAVVKNSIEIIDLLCKYNITSENYLNSIKCANHLKNYELESYLKKKLKNKKRK